MRCTEDSTIHANGGDGTRLVSPRDQSPHHRENPLPRGHNALPLAPIFTLRCNPHHTQTRSTQKADNPSDKLTMNLNRTVAVWPVRRASTPDSVPVMDKIAAAWRTTPQCTTGWYPGAMVVE